MKSLRENPVLRDLLSRRLLLKAGIFTQIHRNGKLIRTSWEEVFKFILENTHNLTPQEAFFCASGKITNGDNYVLQKFARLVYQTNNIDSCCTVFVMLQQ